MNVFEQFDAMMCRLVLEAKDKKERVVALVCRDVYQAAMKHLNDQRLIGGTADDSSDRVYALAKAASWLAGMAAALSVPGGGDSAKLAEFWAWFLEDAGGAEGVFTKAMMRTITTAHEQGDKSAAKALEMIAEIMETKGKLQ